MVQNANGANNNHSAMKFPRKSKTIIHNRKRRNSPKWENTWNWQICPWHTHLKLITFTQRVIPIYAHLLMRSSVGLLSEQTCLGRIRIRCCRSPNRNTLWVPPVSSLGNKESWDHRRSSKHSDVFSAIWHKSGCWCTVCTMWAVLRTKGRCCYKFKLSAALQPNLAESICCIVLRWSWFIFLPLWNINVTDAVTLT